MKRILSVLLILSMTLSFRAFCAPNLHQSYSSFSGNETVTLIVELKDAPVLAESSSYKASYSLFNSDEDNIKEAQNEALKEINESILPNASAEFSYTQLFNGFSLTAPVSSISEIKKISNVKNVYISRDYKAPELMLASSSEVICAPEIHNASYTGQGQVIAFIDGFLNVEHEMFKSSIDSPALTKSDIENIILNKKLSVETISADSVYHSEKIPFAYNYCLKNNNVFDATRSHGTHVTAIAAGKNGILENGDKFSGIAPDAQIVFMNVQYPLTDDDNTEYYISSDSVLAALDDAAKLEVDAINLSLGVDFANGVNSAEKTAITTAINAGIAVSCASGNQPRTNISTNSIGYSSLANPSVYPEATAVAAATSTRIPASFDGWGSSWGVYDLNELKPEISAPGNKIYSAAADGYKTSSGTSMATPHITGIYALLNQHYKTSPYSDTFNNLTGSEKVSLFKNLLMSSSVVMRDENDVPYSPRNQGAGLADISAAIKNPVIISGTDGDAKLALGENLSNELNLSFVVKNISKSDVTFDDVSFDVITDGYTVLTNDTSVLNNSPRRLTVLDSSVSSSTITIPSGSECNVSVELTLDNAELSEINEVFTNGFYIDGYVTLKNTALTDNIPDISVPFFGFYGDWDSAPIFDTSIYDEGGSTILDYYGNGTCLIQPINEEYFRVLGESFYSDKLDEKYIAYSSGEDSLLNTPLNIMLGTYRHLASATLTLTDQNYNTVFNDELIFQSQIYSPFVATFEKQEEFMQIPEGEYTLTVTGTLLNSDSTPDDTISFPFAVDNTAPSISLVDYDKDAQTVTLRAEDNRYIQDVYLYYPLENGEEYSYYSIPSHEIGEKITVTLPLGENPPDITDIRVGCTDYAQNDLDVSLESLHRNIGIEPIGFMRNSNRALFSLRFRNNTDSEISSRFVLCYYDKSGSLLEISMQPAITTFNKSEKKTLEFSKYADLTKAESARIFIWNSLGSLSPLDEVYEINFSK